MTAVFRRDLLLLAAVVLLQAAALVWIGNQLTAPLAAAIVVGVTASALVVPAAATQIFAHIRSLAARLQWWHGAWALLLCSDFVFRVRDVQAIQDNPLDMWALYRVALVGIAGLMLLVRLLIGRGEWVWSLFSGLVLVMALFPIAGMISTGWSVFPSWTLYKSIELLVDIAVLAAVLAAVVHADALKSLFDWTWVLFALVQASVWAGALIAPERAFAPTAASLRLQLSGVLPSLSSNGVGHIAAILSVVALSRLLERNRQTGQRLLFWALFLSSFATLILAQTRSALMGFAVGAALVLLISGRAALLFSAAVLGIILLIATNAESTFLEYFRRGQDAQMMRSLSGRTDWWDFAWQRFLERPFSGYGAFAGGRFAALAQMGDQSTSSVHNTYLEAILGLGIFGLLPLLVCLAGTWVGLLKALLARVESSLPQEAIGVLAVLTVRSMFTTDLIWHPALPWFLIMGYAELRRREGRMQIETIPA